MRCLVYLLLVYLVKFGEGGALRCTSDVEDSSCLEEQEKVPELPVEIAPEGSVQEPPTPVLEAECLPGSEWTSNCYDCRCSETGLARCTAQPSCHKDYADPIRCKPNTTFPRDCNTCVCLENGLGLCTLESCTRSVPKKSELQNGKECAPGSHWKSQCNDCGCSPNGYAFCTEKACVDQSDVLMRCAPDTMWNYECNTCWCTSDGRAMCTRMGCSNEVSIEGGFEDDLSSKATPQMNHESYITIAQLSDNKQEFDYGIPHNYESYQNEDDKNDYDQYVDENDTVFNDLKAVVYDHNALELDTDKDESEHNVLKRSVCKPNQSFQVECNTCKCASDGQSYTCTQNECMEGELNKEVEVFMEGEGTDHIERHSVCKPHGTFYIGCNTCHCNNFGTDYSCTNKPCPLPEDVELFHELKETKSSKNKTQKVVCVANRMFIKDCNTCWCNEDGTSFFCTRKVCVLELPDEGIHEDMPEDLRIIKKECRPNEVFELDCNTCRCNPDGKSFSCTRRACIEPVDYDVKNATLTRKTRGITQEAPKACQPGTEFRMDCNKCLCDNEGQDFSCTRNDCNALNGHSSARTKRETSDTLREITSECSPGSVFDKDCNVCRCTTDGRHAMCTIKRCSIVLPSQDNEAKLLPETDPDFRCNPGEQFKRGCNDCSCSADGKSVFCTVRYCDQDITPPPSL